jgi:hypothetical protein
VRRPLPPLPAGQIRRPREGIMITVMPLPPTAGATSRAAFCGDLPPNLPKHRMLCKLPIYRMEDRIAARTLSGRCRWDGRMPGGRVNRPTPILHNVIWIAPGTGRVGGPGVSAAVARTWAG